VWLGLFREGLMCVWMLRWQAKYDLQLEAEVRTWIEAVTGEPLPGEEMHTRTHAHMHTRTDACAL
jgi:hypothetical protein